MARLFHLLLLILANARAFKGQPKGEDFDLLCRELEYRYGGEGTKKFIC